LLKIYFLTIFLKQAAVLTTRLASALLVVLPLATTVSPNHLENYLSEALLTMMQVVKLATSPASARLLPRRSLATAVSDELENSINE